MYDWVKEELCEKGYVSSFTGRKRRFPKYKGLDPFKDAGKLWWDSRSTAWNAMVQGGEADVVRIAMRNIYRKIKAMRKVDPRWERVKLKAQVHDEMLYQAPKEIAEAVAAMVKHEAENCIKLVVPITFDMGVSSENWESAKP
jgi:DNA polymerase-1